MKRGTMAGLGALLLLFLASTTLASTTLEAQRREKRLEEKFPNYELLGSRSVDFGADKDSISDIAKEGRFVSIMFYIDRGDLEMYDVKITFGNGETFSPDTRLKFEEDSRSRQIDLPGEARVVRKVEFFYKSKIRKGKATVKLYGKAAPVDVRYPGYEHLGSRKVSLGVDRDEIAVTGKEGRFVAVMIDVEDGDLEMYDIKITFGNDETFEPETRLSFEEDSRSRQIDLPGEARVIKKVVFWYRSRIKEGHATVNLFGKPADGSTPSAASSDKLEGAYELLGTRKVSLGVDRDEIEVTGKEGRFVALVIRVEDSDLEMYDVKITFGNDDTFSPETRFTFEENSRSRQIDLPGEARVIKKVVFWYRSKIKDGRATVKLYGKPAPVGERYDGFKHLGSRRVDFGFDRDVIEIGADEGRFASFLIEVEDADLEMFDITVTFGNGKTFSPDTRFDFNEDSRSRRIDLPGEARVIAKIEFHYRSESRRDGKATVNLYGKKPEK